MMAGDPELVDEKVKRSRSTTNQGLSPTRLSSQLGESSVRCTMYSGEFGGQQANCTISFRNQSCIAQGLDFRGAGHTPRFGPHNGERSRGNLQASTRDLMEILVQGMEVYVIYNEIIGIVWPVRRRVQHVK